MIDGPGVMGSTGGAWVDIWGGDYADHGINEVYQL